MVEPFKRKQGPCVTENGIGTRNEQKAGQASTVDRILSVHYTTNSRWLNSRIHDLDNWILYKYTYINSYTVVRLIDILRYKNFYRCGKINYKMQIIYVFFF